MKSFTISEIDIQIGEQLYLHIENIIHENYIMNALPDNCKEKLSYCYI